jgi:PadR family transcriptional regulator, regulatory protein PadR
MPADRPLSIASVAVLKAVADGVRYGFDIMDATALPSGSVYPILGRLEEAGFVRSRWEKEDAAHRAGRPARRLYQITATGARALTAAIEHYRTLGGLLPARAPRPSSA